MADKFDCVIVGAGPAGSAAAYRLAKEGLSVAVFERGEYPGAKNMFGGVLYSTVLGELIPGFMEHAPVERHIARRRYSILTKDSEAAFDMSFDEFNRPPYNNSFTVLRARFDRWFAAQAEDAGAMLVTEAVADDFITEGGRIKGVKLRIEGGDVLSDVVICAEGANSLLAERAGLRKRPSARSMALGVKEILSLPRDAIDDRFSLDGSSGAAFEYFGEAVGGVEGGGFIYTNKETLSVGVVCPISVLRDGRLKPNELIDNFKKHPAVRNLLRGAKSEEYSAHMIPEGGLAELPELTGDGVMLVGDCAGLVNTSLYKEGTNLAMASGVHAADAVVEAKRKGDFTKAGLAGYAASLSESFVMKDLKRYRDVPSILGATPELFREYPESLLEFLRKHFTISGKSKDETHREIKKLIRGKVSLWKMVRDILRLRRVIG